jgi:hypothetical protein
VFVFYVITTTTTNTIITAPIVAANGPIDYVGGGITVSPAGTSTGAGTGAPNNGVAVPGTAAGVSCIVAPSAAGVATKRVTCPGSFTAKGVIKLLCSPSRGRRTAHIARRHTRSAAAGPRTTAKYRVRAHRRPAARNVYLCKRI